MQHGFTRDERGLTLMELIIVLAVIAIIGAILAPNFLYATDKARIKSDIESARVIQAAIESYNAEQAAPMPAGDVTGSIIPALAAKGYLSASDASSPQTDAAVWVYGADGAVKLDITACAPKIKGDVYNTLSDRDKMSVIVV